jgi:hypothetical protein
MKIVLVLVPAVVRVALSMSGDTLKLTGCEDLTPDTAELEASAEPP